MLDNTTNTASASEVSVGIVTKDGFKPEPSMAVFYDIYEKPTSGNFSAEEPYAPFMSLKHWLKLDKIYKRLTRKRKKVSSGPDNLSQ